MGETDFDYMKIGVLINCVVNIVPLCLCGFSERLINMHCKLKVVSCHRKICRFETKRKCFIRRVFGYQYWCLVGYVQIYYVLFFCELVPECLVRAAHLPFLLREGQMGTHFPHVNLQSLD